jgi:class 3 adenylate cyclase
MGTVDRDWEWKFAASPAALWPLLADTARFNEAAGLPRYSVTDVPQPDGSVRRIGMARRLGFTLRWEEGVPQWMFGQHFSHERRFAAGPLRRVATEITIRPATCAGSQVRYRLSLETRGRTIAALLRLGVLARFGRILDRLFQEAADFAEGSRERAFTTPPPQIAPSARHRVTTLARALAGQGYGVTEQLASHLVEAAESDLERMRPRTLARRWGAEPREVIETCLAAARAGLLMLRWDLLCPRCRGAKATVASLDQLPRGAHCPSCNIDFTRDFSRNVEVTFEPEPVIRSLGTGTYCLASPLVSEHVRIQRLVAPGGTSSFAADLADGEYRARTVEPGGSTDFRVEGGRVPEILLIDADVVLGGTTVPGGIRIRNEGSSARTLVIEDRAWARDTLTAHEVTTMQAFRDLFSDAVLRPGDQVEIRRVALLFTDIRGSSALYNRAGDARAYGWVREHYAVLTRAIRRHDGAVVKTIGDAVMAAFSDPAAALEAALAIRQDIAQLDRSLAAETGEAGTILVKLGLHCGPCIAVTLNDRLDYFGRTVNLAARLQGESRGGDIVLSETMASDPAVTTVLEALEPVAESAVVKGFPEPVALRRVQALDCPSTSGQR